MKEQQRFRVDERQKQEASREKMLVMPAPSSIYVSRASLGHRGLLSSKRQWAGMMLVQRGSRLHCTVTCAECSAWNERAYARPCVMLSDSSQWQSAASGFFHCWLEKLWEGGGMAVGWR
jgi:hypothetical protein